MKKSLFFLFFFTATLSLFAQNDASYIICRFGFTFEMSTQRNWGYGKPVVLSVVPNSSADAAGLNVFDVIEKINGQSTEGVALETVLTWLQNSQDDKISLTVSNLKDKNKDLAFNKHCHLNIGISEKDLAGVYAFYSLENSQTRLFTCPFEVNANAEFDLINYKTFGLPEPDAQNESLERIINQSIIKELESKGLVYSEESPNLLVQTYYKYDRNPNYRPSPKVEKFPVETRYNRNTQTWEVLPIYFNPLINSEQAQFYLQLGIRLIDQKRSLGSNAVVVWEIEANELLQSNYSLENYAQFHIPLMFMNYPYCKSKRDIQYAYEKVNYDYSGINYNIDDLKEIVEVDASSPAEKAGIQPGDIVERINDIKFVDKSRTADNNYKQFIYKTTNLRDAKTQFTNAEGFTKCMYWDKMKYAQIADVFKKPEYSTAFSYLFYFAPYINLSGTNIVTFSIRRGNDKLEYKVKPVILKVESFGVK